MRNRFSYPCLGLALLLSPLASRGADQCFEFGARSYPNDDFRLMTGDAAVIKDIEAQLKLPEKDRHMFPIGPIDSGNGGFNSPWHWHFVTGKWQMAEMSIEVCDASPPYIEAHVKEWIKSPTTYCPWGGYVLRVCPTSALSPRKAGAASAESGRPVVVDGKIRLDGIEVTPAGRTAPP